MWLEIFFSLTCTLYVPRSQNCKSITIHTTQVVHKDIKVKIRVEHINRICTIKKKQQLIITNYWYEIKWNPTTHSYPVECVQFSHEIRVRQQQHTSDPRGFKFNI